VDGGGVEVVRTEVRSCGVVYVEAMPQDDLVIHSEMKRRLEKAMGERRLVRLVSCLVLGLQLVIVELCCPDIKYLRGQRLQRQFLAIQIL